MDTECFLNSYKCYLIGFADDSVLLAPSSGAPKILPNKFYALLNKWRLKINIDKCAVNVEPATKATY